jgi:chitodextrinase
MAHASTPGCEYCDITDFMGTGNNKLRHNNAPHKDQMGWLQGAQVQTITQSGTYDIAPLEPLPVDSLAPQAIKIFKADSGEYYYLSYRRAIGFDTSLSPISQLDRLAVHRATGDGSGGNTYLLAQLTDGESHVDAVNGITITVISHNSDYVTVELSLNGSDPTPTCTAGIPQLSLSPASQSANAGSTLDYAIHVTNQDSDACANSTFALNDSIPTGWTGTLSPASLNLAPGQSGTAVLSVTSAASATASTYTVGVNVTDNNEAVHSASDSASYTVAQACAVAAPGLSLSPGSQSGDAGATLAYTILLMNNDSASCNASTFDLTIATLPSGWNGSLSTQSLALSPGATGTATLSVTSSETATAGNYSVQLGAADAQEALHAQSTSATYVANDTIQTEDTEAPTRPTGLAASSNTKQISLNWSASSDNVGVTGYRVYRDGVVIATTVETGYTDRNGASNVMYEYTVDAYDVANNASARSAPVTAGKAKAKGQGGGSKGKGRTK